MVQTCCRIFCESAIHWSCFTSYFGSLPILHCVCCSMGCFPPTSLCLDWPRYSCECATICSIWCPHCSCDNNWFQTMYLSGHCTDSYSHPNCQSTQPQGNQIAVDSWLSACCWPLPRVFLITGEVSVLFTFWPWSGGFGSSQLCLPVWHLLGVCLQEVVSWECDDCGMYYKRAS